VRLKFLVLAIVLLFFVAGNVAAAPNLRINWVQYAPASERIVAEVFNDSVEKAEGFTVDFYVDGKMFSTYSAGETISLGPKSTVQVFADYPFDEKDHEFYAIVDPANAVAESNEEDNSGLQKASFEERDGTASGNPVELEGPLFSLPYTIFALLVMLAFAIICVVWVVKLWRIGRD